MTVLLMVTYENNIDLERQVIGMATNVTVLTMFYLHESGLELYGRIKNISS